jgi:hypothetical protein
VQVPVLCTLSVVVKILKLDCEALRLRKDYGLRRVILTDKFFCRPATPNTRWLWRLNILTAYKTHYYACIVRTFMKIIKYRRDNLFDVLGSISSEYKKGAEM